MGPLGLRSCAAALLVAAILWPAAALATGPMPWTIVTERSDIRFGYTIDSEQRHGTFHDFSGRGRLGITTRADAALVFRIRTDSIDLGNALVSAYATSSEWFDSRNHPYATYRLTGLEAASKGDYAATGELTIKGRTVVLQNPVDLVVERGVARAAGTLTISREAFGLGTQISDLLVDVGDLVTVRFELVAKRVE